MGYSTDFTGRFNLTKPLTAEQAAYLSKFSDTRRMKRNAKLTELRPDPVRVAVGLPVGPEGGYFVGEEGFMGQGQGGDVIDFNTAPAFQPSYWCQWIPTEDLAGIEWDQGEKFYDYVTWLKYLIEHFLKPWGHVLNGDVEWQGESPDDFGKIIATDNVVTTQQGHRTYGKQS